MTHHPWRGWLLDMYLGIGLVLAVAALFECCGPGAGDSPPPVTVECAGHPR
ncbi:MAG TPA: hypothetical protein VIA18_14535 [Polyangia bacterium]|jgi:hypothetical protein|nr:hypothetical protein [Polyangia bacterium]HWE27869.1 hypothetical protein [Polyangia bacterium]